MDQSQMSPKHSNKWWICQEQKLIIQSGDIIELYLVTEALQNLSDINCILYGRKQLKF